MNEEIRFKVLKEIPTMDTYGHRVLVDDAISLTFSKTLEAIEKLDIADKSKNMEIRREDFQRLKK